MPELKEIEVTNRDEVYRLFQCNGSWCQSSHSGSVSAELAEILAVDFDDAEGISKLNPDWRWENQERLQAACSSFDLNCRHRLVTGCTGLALLAEGVPGLASLVQVEKSPGVIFPSNLPIQSSYKLV
jgi:hypothetical protein